MTDEREQRRGLVLGLTLAELLLLLLFLLLLALSTKLQLANREINEINSSLEQLKPLQAALLSAGAADISGVKELATRFQRLHEIEQENARLRQENLNSEQASELTKSLGLQS